MLTVIFAVNLSSQLDEDDASLPKFLTRQPKPWLVDISQGSVASHLRYDGIFSHNVITNFLLVLTVKEFWKSVNIWQSYGVQHRLCHFWTTLYLQSRPKNGATFFYGLFHFYYCRKLLNRYLPNLARNKVNSEQHAIIYFNQHCKIVTPSNERQWHFYINKFWNGDHLLTSFQVTCLHSYFTFLLTRPQNNHVNTSAARKKNINTEVWKMRVWTVQPQCHTWAREKSSSFNHGQR